MTIGRMNHAEFVSWTAGRMDAMGRPFADWLLADIINALRAAA